MRRIRQAVLLGSIAGVVCFAVWGEQLLVRSTGDDLKVSAPRLHFLTGKPLERIHNGNTVPYDFQLSVLADGKSAVLRRSFERFVFSYDLWEQKFRITRMRSVRAQVSNLSAEAAEAWCVDKMEMPVSGLPMDQPLWLRLEVRAQDPHEQAPPGSDDGMSLAALIDVFSRASKVRQPQYWRAEAGPLKLADLRHVTMRGGF